MQLVSYYDGNLKTGAVVDDQVWDLRRVVALQLLEVHREPDADALASAAVPADMGALIARGDPSEQLAPALDRLLSDPQRAEWCRAQRLVVDLAGVRLLPPILRPSKIVMIGNSYRDHIENVRKAKGEDVAEIPPDVKVSFFKTSSALTAPGDPVRYPDDTNDWDFEGEFCIVIGRTCTDVSIDRADDYIFGYTALNDASVRDVPQSLGGLTSPKAKSADTLAPLGPWIVTRDGLAGDPNNLAVKVWVNDELRQDSNTSQLIWPVQEMVSATSRFMTLYPGDIIATGASAGVGLETGRYLNVGDRVRIAIEGLGVLENPVGPPLRSST